MSDDWTTPKWLKTVFAGWDDPCPLGGIDGLLREWGSQTFVNPPYSDPSPWVDKAIRQARAGKVIVLLLRHDSSTEWWRRLHESGGHFFAYIGRMPFGEATAGGKYPTVLVVL